MNKNEEREILKVSKQSHPIITEKGYVRIDRNVNKANVISQDMPMSISHV